MVVVKLETGEYLELPIESFMGAELEGISLHRAVFEFLDFSGASFTSCDLRNSVFYFCVLNGARVERSSLINAILTGSKMRASNLSG